MEQAEIFDTRTGPSVFSLAVEFNLFPVRYMHLSWLQKDEHYKLIAQLNVNDATHVSLSDHLLKRFKLSDDFDFDFSAKEKRIVFASSEELERLAFYLGIILNEGVIRSAVRRKERLALEHCLGKTPISLPLKRLSLSAGLLSTLVLACLLTGIIWTVSNNI